VAADPIGFLLLNIHWEFLQDLQRNMRIGCSNLSLGDHSIAANQPKKECRYGKRRKADFGIGNRNSRSEPVPIDREGLVPIQDDNHHELVT
jgi:hypothetical protein